MPLEIWWAVMLASFGVVVLSVILRINNVESFLDSISFIDVPEEKEHAFEKFEPKENENKEVMTIGEQEITDALITLGTYCHAVKCIAKENGMNACKDVCIIKQYYRKCKLDTLNLDVELLEAKELPTEEEK